MACAGSSMRRLASSGAAALLLKIPSAFSSKLNMPESPSRRPNQPMVGFSLWGDVQMLDAGAGKWRADLAHDGTEVSATNRLGYGNIGIPWDALTPILQMLIAARFKFVLMRGTRFRHRSAKLRSLRLETKLTEDDVPMGRRPAAAARAIGCRWRARLRLSA